MSFLWQIINVFEPLDPSILGKMVWHSKLKTLCLVNKSSKSLRLLCFKLLNEYFSKARIKKLFYTL